MKKNYFDNKNIVTRTNNKDYFSLFLFLVFSTIIFGQTRTFDANGTFVVPSGVTSITVQAWGAGGGGSSNAGSNNARGGAGGGGGAYATATFAVTAGTSLPVVVGAGGVGGSISSVANSGDGGGGGFSTITGYNSTIYAAGGSGGVRNTSANVPTIDISTAAGGAGGTTASSIGTTKSAGANGGVGNYRYYNPTPATSGAGGAGANGGGAGGASIGVLGTTSTGNPGVQPGGGGGGSRTSENDGSRAGGTGGAGRVIITWTCPTTAGTLSGDQYICRYGTMTTTLSSTISGGTWSSSNTAIATVNATTGLVTSTKPDDGVSRTVTITYSVGGTGGCPVFTATRDVYIANGPGSGPVSLTGSNTQCQGSTTTYTIAPDVYSSSYIWTYLDGSGAVNPTATITPAADGLSASVTFNATATSGNIRVQSVNGCGNGGGGKYLWVTVSPSSYGGTLPVSASGCINPSTGNTGYITYLNLTGYVGTSFRWESSIDNFVSNINPISNNNNGIDVSNLTQTTYYRAVVKNAPCTIESYSNVCKVTVSNAVPSAAGGISGSSSVCPGQTGVAYSVPAIANAAGYNWNLPAGATIASGANTNSITVNYSGSAASGNITVKGTNNCGDGAVSANFQITVNNVTTPTATVTAQPNCSKLTGTITLGGLPTSGTIYQTVNSVTTNFPVSQVAGNQTISGLAAGSYTFTVNVPGGCASAASDPVTVNAFTDISTWNGTGWIPGVPGISSKAVFAENYNENEANLDRDEDIEACSCEVRTGAKVIIKKGHTLKVVNEVKVETGAELTFENNASLVQVNEDPNINSGDISYHRHTAAVKRYDYTYWSSPVAGQTMHDLSPNTFYDKYYSYNDKWVVSKYGEAIMKVGEGYIIRAPQDHEINTAKEDKTPVFKGEPNNGKVEKVLEKDKSYLLGNPYPSAINADKFLEKNMDVLVGTLYFWTHNSPPAKGVPGGDATYSYTSNDYATYNRTGGVGTTPAPSDTTPDKVSTPTGKIAAAQGFFAPTKAAGNVVFNNTMRISGGATGTDNSQFFKLSTSSKTTATSAATEKSRIWLNLTNNEGAFKQALIGYISGATNDYDGAFDGATYDGNIFVDFYSVNNEKNLTIQGRALPFAKKDSVALGYKSTIKGEFQISIDQADGVLATQNVFLEDKDLKVIHDLKKEAYTFSTEKGTFNSRFVLRYADKNAVDEVIVPEVPGQESNAVVMVSVKDGEIKINSTLTKLDKVVVYDAAGRKLFQKNKIDANVLLIPHFVWNHQVLIVDMVLIDGTKHSKKIIN